MTVWKMDSAEFITIYRRWLYFPKKWFFVSRSSHPEVFWEKGALNDFAKFTGKHLCQSQKIFAKFMESRLCWSVFLNKVAGQGLYHCSYLFDPKVTGNLVTRHVLVCPKMVPNNESASSLEWVQLRSRFFHVVMYLFKLKAGVSIQRIQPIQVHFTTSKLLQFKSSILFCISDIPI